MSLIDLASLVLAPTATKEGKVYSAIPDTGDGDMTFTRGSSATRINSAGLIEKERANFLLQSNSFDTTWTNSGSTETGGQSGYDGSSDAWLLQSTTNGNAYLRQTYTNSGVQTFSFYAKAGNVNFVQVYVTGADSSHYFNLSAGTAETPTGGGKIISNITSLGSGWYRCECIYQGSSTGANIYIRDAVNGTASIGDNILIQDAMLNEGLVAQPYIETTTTAVYEGITDDVPRVDYSGGGCPSLLLEGQRTNLVTQSEYFGAWTESGLTITDNNATSPEGVLNAAKLTLPSGSATKRIALGSMPVTAVARSYSFFVKSDDITAVQLVHSGDLQGYARFDISTGVVGSSGTKTTSNIENYGNGWYRCVANFDSSNAFGSTIYLYISDSATGGYGGSTSAEGDLFVYGAQYEEGSYSTSYTPTYGTSTTRVQDSCSKTGISELIGQTEGTMFVEFDIDSNVNTEGYIIRIDESSFNDTIYIVRLANGNLSMTLRSGGSGIASYTASNISGHNKAAFGYKSGNFAFYLNGTQLATSTSTYTNGITYNEIRLGAFNASGLATMAGKIKQAIVFPTRLTNTELAELTKL